MTLWKPSSKMPTRLERFLSCWTLNRWSNAKREMDSMKKTYGSIFASDKIRAGRSKKLQDTIHCGGLHIKKIKIVLSILEELKRRHRRWNLDHLLESGDENAMKELISYKFVGSKPAFVVLG